MSPFCLNHGRESNYLAIFKQNVRSTLQGLALFVVRFLAIRTDRTIKLNDPSLLHEASLLDGQWVQAKSGETFEVTGK
jgi:hypothetical protein